MNYNKLIIAVVIITIILVIILIIVFSRLNYRIEKFNTKNYLEPAGYADITDPYDKPFIIKQLISPNDCQVIIDHSIGKLIDSEVVGGKIQNIRNSKQCWISKNDPIIEPLFERVAAIFNLSVDKAEDLQVVRYLPNQYYNEHHDACCDDNKQCRDFVNNGGQRMLTVLIYLNEEFEGGNTFFRNLDLKIKPNRGDAIVFFPLARNSDKCHPYALHAGLPVENGVKWIANIWFRK